MVLLRHLCCLLRGVNALRFQESRVVEDDELTWLRGRWVWSKVVWVAVYVENIPIVLDAARHAGACTCAGRVRGAPGRLRLPGKHWGSVSGSKLKKLSRSECKEFRTQMVPEVE